MKLQVTVEVPWVFLVKESVVVPVIKPPQLSFAVGAAGIVAEHCPVTSGRFAILKIGDKLSTTVISAVQVLVSPFESVTVNVTLFSPTLKQSKIVLSTDNVKVSPASTVEPLLTCAAVTFATPLASKYMVTS